MAIRGLGRKVNTVFKRLPAIIVTLALMSVSVSARADGIDPSVLQKFLGTEPAVNNTAIYLTDNEDKVVRLDQDAASVIVNNPDHASVLLDSPRVMIIMPRAPGATSFSVLDANGNTIMHKDVIVTNRKRQYVRIQRVCNGSSGCTPTSYYYCPNGCYQVTPVAASGGNVNIPPPPAAPSAGSSGGGAAGNGSLRGKAQNIIHPTGQSSYPGMIP